ncbi:MAG TPA: SDR family NAD(P)-dependent oxidoreductase [Longimicrobiales bacterium]|nr:SDR family NAD(P)-dependent oxidoreductase [Longimicrobiales bacterium]
MRRVAFITGASSGLGRGMARRLAREGYAVAVTARRLPELESLAGEIRHEGGEALPLALDVADAAAVGGAVHACTRGLGPVDLLVANAGISEQTGARNLSAATVERVMRVNFLGAVYAAEAVLPSMLERNRGQLAAVGSLAGYGGLPLTAAYSASKGALHNFFESLRVDLRGTGVDVTFITPGYVKSPLTDRNAHRMPFLVETDEAVDRMVGAILRRDPLLTFPFPLAAATWLAQILPSRLYDRIASGIRREKKEG